MNLVKFDDGIGGIYINPESVVLVFEEKVDFVTIRTRDSKAADIYVRGDIDEVVSKLTGETK